MLSRIKSFTVALIMMVSLLHPMCIQAQQSDDIAGRELCEKLTSVGISKAEEIYGKSEVSRGDFTALAVQLGNVEAGSEIPFSDVSSKDENYRYIAAAYDMGYICGAQDGCFYPERSVTLSEALTILLRVLGYDIPARISGSNGSGYLSIADRIDLTDDVSGKYNQPVSANAALQLAVNTLEAVPMDITQASKNDVLFEEGGKTLLERNFDVRKGGGIVERNEFTDLYTSKVSTSENMVMIDGYSYPCEGTDAADYLGVYSEFYYNIDSEKIIFISEMKRKNEIIQISSYDIDEITTDNVILNNGRKIRFSSTVKFILNGKMESISAEKLKADLGKYVLIDNDKDSVIDVIKLTSYQAILVKAVSPQGYIVTGSDDAAVKLDPTQRNVSVIIKKDGEVIDLSAINADDIMLYAESSGSGRVLKQAEICTNSVEGVISGIGDKGIDINNSCYPAPESFLKTADLGMSGTAYLDCFGGCVAFKRDVRMVYGYLKAIAQKPLGKVECRIFTENNRWVTLPLKKEVKYNGSPEPAEKVMQYLGNTPEQVRQLIEYKVNEEGSVIEINTAKTFTKMSDEEMSAIEENVFRLTAEGEMKYLSNGSLLGDDIALTSSTIVFSVPSAGDEEEKYDVIYYSSFDGDEKYNVKVYNADKTRIAEVCVVYDMSSVVSSDASLMVVKGLSEIRVDDDFYTAIRGYMNGEEIMFPVEDEGILSKVSGGLRKNDIIRVAFDKNGFVAKINRVYSSANGIGQKFITGTFGNKSATVAGRVISCDYATGKCLIQYANTGYVIVTLKSGAGGVYVFDENADKIFAAGINEDIVKDDYVVCTTSYSKVNQLVILRNQ